MWRSRDGQAFARAAERMLTWRPPADRGDDGVRFSKRDEIVLDRPRVWTWIAALAAVVVLVVLVLA